MVYGVVKEGFEQETVDLYREYLCLSCSHSLCDVLQLRDICVHLADDMAREALRGKTLTVKLKSAATFEVITSTILVNVSSAVQELHDAPRDVILLCPESCIELKAMM